MAADAIVFAVVAVEGDSTCDVAPGRDDSRADVVDAAEVIDLMMRDAAAAVVIVVVALVALVACLALARC